MVANLQESLIKQRLLRLSQGGNQTQQAIYQGFTGRFHKVLLGGQQHLVPPSRVLTRGALVVGEPVSFVQGFLDGLSGD
jgi:hypothetical protein